MPNQVKLALVQQKATLDRDENLNKGIEAIREAAANGANIICFAELAFERFYPQCRASEGFEKLAETIPGPTTDQLCALAKELDVVIAANLFERDGDQTFDSSPVIDADGMILGTTRMIHITDYEHFHEKGYYAEGDRGAPVFDTKYGRLGIAICYDRHYPEYMRAMATGGAQLVIIPQAGSVGEWPEGLYEAEVRVAAFQNGYFAALCNRVGEEEHLTFAGESFVCDPHGVVMQRAGQGTEEILYSDLDLGELDKSAAHRLFLGDRRPDLYADWMTRKAQD